MEKEEFKLVLAPEERFVSAIKRLHKSNVVCCDCHKVVSTIFYPYGYDENENDMWYLGLCPNCKAIMYVKD